MGLIKFVGFFIVSLVAMVILLGLINNDFISGFIIALIIGFLASKDG